MQPFTPFVAEELWHLLEKRSDGDDIILAQWPSVKPFNQIALTNFDKAVEVITQIRNIRKKNNIATKIKMELFVRKNKEINLMIFKLPQPSCKMDAIQHADN